MPEDEKTEQPTPRKRRRARQEGQVARSNEVNSAFLLLVCWTVLRFSTPYMINELGLFFHHTFQNTRHLRISQENLITVALEAMTTMLLILAPVMLGALITGLATDLLQVGFLFSSTSLKPSLNRINPIEGAKRIFSKRVLVEMGKAVCKAGLIGYTAYAVIRENFSEIVALGHTPRPEALRVVGMTAIDIAFRASFLLVIIALFDYLYQRWEHEKNLMMTKQELKEERKQTEGSPELKSRLRERQREMSLNRMMQAIPEADVVITNPTHLAVALRYEAQEMESPVVVAKGQRKMAERIRDLAAEHQVPVVEDRPLARLLFQSTEINEEIPYELYQAVAEVLAFVYRVNRGQNP